MSEAMKWIRHGDTGMVCGEYRVGKFAVDEGALATLYGLWHDKDLIGYFNSFEECKEAAKAHGK